MPNPIGRALRNRRAGQHTLLWALPGLQAPNFFSLTSALEAMAGHVLARARLDGTFKIA